MIKKRVRYKRYEKRKINQPNIWLILMMMLIVVAGVTGITAYLSDVDEAVNEFTMGGNRIELIEQFIPPEKLVPGVEFQKDVAVKNVGPNACFVRIKAVFTDSDMEEYCEVNFNTRNYDHNAEDGYYYYKKILRTDETAPSLFTTVKLSDEIPADEIRDFDILVYTESYQAAGFEDYEDAWVHYQRNKPE